MASFLCDLVKSYVEKLIDGAIAEARHVFCFTCIVKEFEEERAKLEPERITINQRVKEAKARDKDILANVGFLKEEIDKLNQVDTKIKQTCFLGFCPDCIWRYKRGKELANNLKVIKRIIEKGEKLENIELPRHLPDVGRYSTINYISFKSRESKYKELLDALKDDNNYITGLQGMGGTGKTTMAIKVGKELKQSEQFAYVVNTTVSFTPDVKKIQDDIAGSLGLKWEDCNETDRPKKLWSRLTNGDKILVILDDVWDRGPHLDFEAIGIPKGDNHKGCRVLVTSRSKNTFNVMNCHTTIELDLLSEEEAWIMFEWYAGICNSSSKKLINKGRKIAKECKQLPVAVSVIASSLKGQQNREQEWDVTLNSLKQPVSMHGVEDDMVGIYNCLKISYDNLKNKKAKGLFLICSVFREDEEYSVEVLTRHCIGVGLFGEDYGFYNDARNEVVVAKNKLVDSCLLLEVHKKHLKMHDLVRDAAQWIANKEIQCVKLFDKKQKSLVENQTNIKYLLCEGKCIDVFNLKLDGSKLETLIVKLDRDDNRKCIEVPNSFFENVIMLSVLNLSGYYYDVYPFIYKQIHLPDSVRSLKNIRSMLIDYVDLGDISILGNLQSLETLDLVHCKINELPNQITELRKFRLLKLEDCEITMNNPFEVIERCSSLEELYFEDSFNVFCREITMPDLQRYHIMNCWKPFYSDRTNFLKYVVFCGDGTCRFSEETLKYCMQTSEALCLEGIKGEWRNLMPEIVELGMNDLVELHLCLIPQLRCLIDTTGCSQAPNVFSKLVALELEEMENLEELFNGALSFESLNNLEKLSIKDCKHLRSLFKGMLLCNLKSITIQSCPLLVFLFEVSTSQSLVVLETLKISNCEGLKTIIADERREDEEINDSGNNKSLASVFSKLKVIDIERCHRLESILPFLSAQDLRVLEVIKIRDCDGLKYVFGQSQHVELVSLSELELSELPNFIGIFEECYDPMSSCVKGSSSASKAEIQLDPIKCNTFSWWTHICCQTRIPLVDVDVDQPQDCSLASESSSYCLDIWERVQCVPIQSKILCNIKEIVLTHFPKMKSVFILSIAPIMQLENLKIMNCDELKHVVIDSGDHNTGGNNCINVFPKLKELWIEGCAQLEYIFGHHTNDQQNHMEIQLHLPELRRLCLVDLPCLLAMCPTQYRTTFPSLDSLELRKCSQVDMDHMIIKESYSLRVQCLPIQSKILCNIKKITLSHFPKMKSVFILSIAQIMQLENLIIMNCDELKHVIIDTGDNNTSGNNWVNVLPKLKDLYVQECAQLEYIFGHDTSDHQNHMELHLPELRRLDLYNLPSLVAICPKQYRTTFPSLKSLELGNCSQVDIKSIFHSVSESMDHTIIKALSGNVDHFLTLESLMVKNNSKVENIFSLNEIDGQKLDLGLQAIKLRDLPMMTCLFEGPKNSFALVNLTSITIKRCDKLKIAFSTSILRFLPKLLDLKIEECKELEDIIEDDDDLENKKNTISSRTCFPKLKTLVVMNCNKLKFVFPFSVCKELPELKFLVITQANELEEIFKSEDDQKVDIPNLIVLAFDMLPSLCFAQGNQFQAVKNRFVRNCQKLTLTSASTTNTWKEISLFHLGYELTLFVRSLFNRLPSSETTEHFDAGIGAQATLEHKYDLASVENVGIEQLPSAETTEDFELPSVENVLSLTILPTNSELKGSTLEKTPVATASTSSGTKNEPPLQVVAPNLKGIEIEGICKTNNDQVSINDDAFVIVNSNVEEQISKGDEIIVSITKPSPNITSSIASQFPSTPSKGDPFLVKSELEELVSKNHLDCENLSLLTDFLVENPSVRLKDTSLSNRYKGCAYNLLAELLKFLETHSLLEVSGSSHSEFVELLQDARSFAFDNEWLNGVERRALFPEIQVTQDALEKILDSKKRVTKDVEVLRMKIDILSQHVEDLKHQLTSSEAVLESIIQQEAVLSAPIGY